jgi:hypothetical protein
VLAESTRLQVACRDTALEYGFNSIDVRNLVRSPVGFQVKMSDRINPYAPGFDVPTEPEPIYDASPTPKKLFRWQVLPTLFCVLAILPCSIRIFETAVYVNATWSRWDNYFFPNARMLSLSTSLLIAFGSVISLAFAARRWITCRHVAAMLFTIAGIGLLMSCLREPYLLRDFWRGVTLGSGWDTD